MHSQNIFHIDSGSPNGYITAQAPAMCYTNDGAVWVKINDAHDNKGWVTFIAATPPQP